MTSSSNPRNLRNDIVFAFALAVACYLAWFVRDVLMLLYVSALFAVVLTPLVRFTSRIRIRNWRPFKGTAILVLLLVLVGAIVVFGYLALPPVIHDLQTFSQEAPARLPGILDKLKRIPFLGRLNDTAISGKAQDFASNAATYLLASIKNWVGILFNIIM
jgi:predicted PurR-regulated permease PerM